MPASEARASARQVAVIGAGWSGLASALDLSAAGVPVTLFDAAPAPGGRARRVDLALGGSPEALDNGQHLLLGGYSEVLALMVAVGVDPVRTLQRAPFDLHYPDGWRIAARDAPAPWHLLGARTAGLTLRERIALGLWFLGQRRRGWQITPDCAAAGLFSGHPVRLVERLWEPLCVGALNVRLAAASARVFLTVLRDSLGATAQASHLMIPRTDLSSLFAAPAAELLAARGARLCWRDPVNGLATTGATWTVATRVPADGFDAVVLALPPDRAASLLATLADPALQATCALLSAIRTAPIATVYLRYPPATRLPTVALALREDPARNRFGQWAFDRGALDPARAGVVSVVISGEGPHRALSNPSLASAVAAQLSAELGLPAPLAATALVEKRATILPAPGLQRPPTRLPVRGLYLAGDAADSPYPSTLEGSVRAGRAAARALLEDLGRPRA
jgi:squalene-associated FAD-dependent desaturase